MLCVNILFHIFIGLKISKYIKNDVKIKYMGMTERINFIYVEFMRSVLFSALCHRLVLYYEGGGNTSLLKVGSNHQQSCINSQNKR